MRAYAVASTAVLLAAMAVQQTVRVLPLKNIEIELQDLPSGFDGDMILHLTDLHISRLFPAAWARAVVERSNAFDADLIAISGDFIDGLLALQHADAEPLRALDGLWVISGSRCSLRLMVSHPSGQLPPRAAAKV